jgi:acetyltransferase
MEITIRPIRPEDEPLMVKFDQSLSEESVYLRYAHLVKLSSRVTHERLSRLCFIDYDREMALVAEYQHPETGETKIIGVGRLSKGYGNDEVEFSLLVSDSYQRQGIGTELLRQLLNIARQEKMPLIFAEILSDNRIMQNICQQLGFTLNQIIGEPMVRAEIEF